MSVTFQSKICSKLDRTQKYIFLNTDKKVLEVAYIDKGDGKNIFCVPSQTACAMACRFCHTTEVLGKIRPENLWSGEIVDAVKYAYEDLDLSREPKPLLVSYMGCGEPLCNVDEVLGSMVALRNTYRDLPLVRFAIATLMPRTYFKEFVRLSEHIREENLLVKAHLSLHFTYDSLRLQWMPRASGILPSLDMLQWYKDYTGNSVEVHYTPIAGINDTTEDIWKLGHMLQRRGIPIKFLEFSTKPGAPYQPSSSDVIQGMRSVLQNEWLVPTEYYDPPGRDVGASCGQFLMDYYVKFGGNRA